MTAPLPTSHREEADSLAPASLLIVDDDPLVRKTFQRELERTGYITMEAENAEQALRLFEHRPDAVLLDYRLPDRDGLEVLRTIRAKDPTAAVVMLTAHSNVDMAVAAMQAGAFHYATKPCPADEIVGLVRGALTSRKPMRSVSTGAAAPELLGESDAMRRVRSLVARVARSPASTVLITGESGTGKELVARAIHQGSRRAGGPIMTITCSALTATLLESELFGHERGAFTDARQQKKGLLELAEGGTVFLDEIGELELGMQAKLLRFLQEKTFRRVGGTEELRANCRIVAATNVDLRAAARAGTFREDLYYRLAVLTVHLPPLRQRGGDVELLLEHFVTEFSRDFGLPRPSISPTAMRVLSNYSWPGNVRELRNATERAVLLCEGNVLELSHFFQEPQISTPGQIFELPAEGVDLRALERDLVKQALERCNGNRTRAGRLLGMNRDQIRYRMEKFGLLPKGEREG